MKHDQEAFNIPEWCEAHRISVGQFYQLEKEGKAPKTFKVGRRRLISKEASAKWRRDRERDISPD